jgi:DNA transformation protein
MAKAPHPLAEFLSDQLRVWAPVTARRLFSGWGVYRGPTIFALILRDTIYFRVDETNRPDYVAASMPPFVHAARHRAPADAVAEARAGTGAPQFQYRTRDGKAIAMPYYEVPASILEDADALAGWAEKAHAAALRAARRKPARRKSMPATRASAR